MEDRRTLKSIIYQEAHMSEYEEMGRCCETCRHDLGGGCCRINLEAECAAGEFEAWEPREDV